MSLKNSFISTVSFKINVLLPVLFLVFVTVSMARGLEKVPQGVQETTLRIEVDDVQNLSEAEKEEVQYALEDLQDAKPYTTVVVTDGTSRIIYEASEESGIVVISKTEEIVSSNQATNLDVPFNLIEEVPVFPGCENLNTPQERKECMVGKITAHVNSNFNTGIAQALPLEGLQKIYVQFKINESGKVVEVMAKAPAPELEQEAIRVVEALPQMIPGKHRGRPVSVVYSLPIQFKLFTGSGEDSTEE